MFTKLAVHKNECGNIVNGVITGKH